MSNKVDSLPSPIADLTPQQRRALLEQLLHERAQRPVPAPQAVGLHHLFEAQARRAPEADAVLAAGTRLSYGELNVRANRLAGELQSQGVGAETLAGICLERSPDLVVGLLGILKAGGACLLLDLRQPRERLATLLADAGAGLLLTRRALAERWSDLQAKVMCLDSPGAAGTGEGEVNPSRAVTAEGLAFVLYASGHGVAIEHRGIVRQLNWLQKRFALTGHDVGLHQAPLDQEAALWEIFWPLISGASVVLADDDGQDDPASLRRIIAERRISFLHFTPAGLAAFIDSLKADATNRIDSLREVFCSGGPLRRKVAEALPRYFSGEFHYFYSLPEACGPVTFEEVQPGSQELVLPIGHPAANPVYVLDQGRQLVPVGVTGEIYVDGAGLAREYWRDPDETARRFVAHPFSTVEGARLFKTGDLGRRLNDGRIELVTSLKGPVWVGGDRVDLGEVEAALLDDPSVTECAVLVRETETADPCLVAYLVTSDPVSPEQLNARLTDRLPAGLRPSAYVPVSAMPLTPAGQVDERALIDLEVIDAELVRQWEEELTSLPEVGRLAVVVQPHTEHLPPLHLSDLLTPGKATAEVAAGVQPAGTARPGHPPGDAENVAWAISDGGPLVIPDDEPQTLTEALVRAATRSPGKGITFVPDDGSQFFQNYASLLEEAKCVLAGLIARGVKPGGRAILQIQRLRDHFSAFWGCVLGGITPVTVAVAPAYDADNAVVQKLVNTWQLLGHPPVIASDSLVDQLAGLKPHLPLEDIEVLPVSQLRSHAPVENLPGIRPDNVLFLQLTSGSTGIAKCIQITHRGVVAHILGGKQFNGYSAEDVSLNWLPMDHVVPILTCHLKDVYLGCQQVAVSTNLILADPLAWLDLIEKYRVTHTWSPNFGYKLVADSLRKAPSRARDLSSIKRFMNAGEQVTLPVVSEFLKLVAPFQVAPQAMQPAFGMAEACTCMTYQNRFDCETGVRRVKKSSLGGRLRLADSQEAEAVDFIDLGGPVPGVQIRVTDQENRLLPEGVIGRFQIKGAVITPGYLNNEPANREAFVGDGWFNSGDLGFILDGRLTLTGREKEIIIINGANFYCYEIEDIVNQIDGVEPTFVASCGLSDPATGTEGLAIFFTPRAAEREGNVELIKSIRTKVAASLGISPAFVIPVMKQEFPKTTSGKIQRTLLKQRLAAGDFQKVLKEIDIHLENANTLPDWFYRKAWRRHAGASALSRQHPETSLIFFDRLGLAEALRAELERRHNACVRVEMGPDFVKLDPHHYRLAPDDPAHYRRLFESLEADRVRVHQILHLWTYDEAAAEPADADTLERAQEVGLYSLLFLSQALEKVQGTERRVGLKVVSNRTQLIGQADEIAYAKTPLLGLVGTISREMPWLGCSHIDLPPVRVEVNLDYLRRELRLRSKEPLVAYRDGERWVPRLEKVDFAQAERRTPPLKEGGRYLISGGLGGISLEVARYLLEHYQTRLLLIGRSSLPDRSAWPKHLGQADALADRIRAYQSLERLGGEVIYEAVDVCDAARLRAAVERAETRWGGELDGVFHLAGIFRERMLAGENRESMSEVLRPKVLGTWSLRQLLKERPGSIFVSFSSVNSFFGGVAVGAYAAANSFLEGFALGQKLRAPHRSYCFHWSMWDEVGMSRQYGKKELSRARGYLALSAGPGLKSFLVGLHLEPAQLLIGLDGGHQNIRRHTGAKPYQAQKLTAYCAANGADLPVAKLQEAAIFDRFRRRSTCECLQVDEMPLTSTGEIDRERLLHGGARRVSGLRALPRTDLEQQLTRIWQGVLSLPQVGIHDNFFELGGHSLLAVRLMSRIREALNIEFPVDKIIENPTIARMARWIQEQGPAGDALLPSLPGCLLLIQPLGNKRPFFCVHPASGSPLCYLNLVMNLGAERPFYGFQSPGLLDGREPLTSVEDMAALYVEAMRAVQPKGPYLIGGWSSGGPVAFEMARIIEAQNEEVAVLALLDCGVMESDAPTRGRSAPSLTDRLVNMLDGSARILNNTWHLNFPRSYQDLVPLAQLVGISLPPTIRAVLRRGLRSQLKFLRGLNAEIWNSIRIFALNTRAGLEYRPAPYRGKATLFRSGRDDSREEDLALADLRKYAEGGVEAFYVGGNHMSIILDRDGSKVLAEKLNECLDRV